MKKQEADIILNEFQEYRIEMLESFIEVINNTIAEIDGEGVFGETTLSFIVKKSKTLQYLKKVRSEYVKLILEKVDSQKYLNTSTHLDILRDTVKRTEISDYSEQEKKLKSSDYIFPLLVKIFDNGLESDFSKSRHIYLASEDKLEQKESNNMDLYDIYSNAILDKFKNIRNIHGILGIASELSELMIALIDKNQTNIKEEIGDILWFLTILADANGLTIEECIEANKRKLEARYKDKFTQDEALNRDLKKEEEALI